MKKFFKSVLAVLVIGAVTAAAVYFTQGSGDQAQRGRRWARPDGPVPVVATQAKLADVPVWLEGVGTAKARNMVTVRPQVDGKILSINFKEGQDVKRGDVLAQIDPVTYQAQLDQAVAKKALDEAQLANAKRDLERYTQLVGNVIAAEDHRHAARAGRAARRADQVRRCRHRERARLPRLHDVVAPIDGRTGIRMVDDGNLVRASDAGIVVITEVQPISVLFTLPQQQLPEINRAVAKRALTVEALETDGKTVLDSGTLQVVDNQVDQTTGTIRMKADFPNTDLQLWPGQFVNVRLLLEHAGAGRRRADVGRAARPRRHVRLRRRQPTTRRPCARSPSRSRTRTLAVIAKGVAAAEPVVTTGFARLKDGAEVKVSPPEEQQARRSLGRAARRRRMPRASAGRAIPASINAGDAGRHAGRPAPRVAASAATASAATAEQAREAKRRKPARTPR